MKIIQLKNFKIVHLALIIVSLSLTACGGGGGGSSTPSSDNASQNTTGQSSPEPQATATPASMLAADENSEPMEISNMDMTSMQESDLEDDEAMNALVLSVSIGNSQ